jgi:hypothetical protein
MVAVQNLKGEIIQLILSRKGGCVLVATPRCMFLVFSFKNILWMKTNMSGFNDAKFQVNTGLPSMLCIFIFAETEFLVASGDSH